MKKLYALISLILVSALAVVVEAWAEEELDPLTHGERHRL